MRHRVSRSGSGRIWAFRDDGKCASVSVRAVRRVLILILICFSAEHNPFFMNVLIEAVIVGLVLLPIYWVAEKVLGAYGKWVTLFVAGAAFHLLFEVTGLNAYYVKTKRV